MKEWNYRMTDPNGLHARPAGAFVNLAKQFQSEIQVTVGPKTANAKRLLALMSLGAKEGALLRISVEGPDEEAALEAIRSHFQSEVPPKTVTDRST